MVPNSFQTEKENTVVTQCVKLPPVMLTITLAAPLPIHVPANALGKVAVTTVLGRLQPTQQIQKKFEASGFDLT